jgi:hypothetical protein
MGRVEKLEDVSNLSELVEAVKAAIEVSESATTLVLKASAYANALALLDDGIRKDAGNPALYYCRCVVHIRYMRDDMLRGDTRPQTVAAKAEASALALVAVRRAVELEPDYAEAYVALAMLTGENAHLNRALALGLERALALQAYELGSYFVLHDATAVNGAQQANNDIVNTMRRSSRDDEWRKSKPQLCTLRRSVLSLPSPPQTVQFKENPIVVDGMVSWKLACENGAAAYAEAVKLAAEGHIVRPEVARLHEWQRAFPALVQEEAGQLLSMGEEGLSGQESTARWNQWWNQTAASLGNEKRVTLAKALLSFEVVKGVTWRPWLRYAEILQSEPGGPAVLVDAMLRRLEHSGGTGAAAETSMEQLRKFCPPSSFSPEAIKIVERLSVKPKYAAIAPALRTCAGLGEALFAPNSGGEQEVASGAEAAAIKQMEAFTALVLAAKSAKALKKLHQQCEEMEAFILAVETEAGEARVESLLEKIREHGESLSEAASEEIQNILDTISDS